MGAETRGWLRRGHLQEPARLVCPAPDRHRPGRGGARYGEEAVPGPGGRETFGLCYSQERQSEERASPERPSRRMEAMLSQLAPRMDRAGLRGHWTPRPAWQAWAPRGYGPFPALAQATRGAAAARWKTHILLRQVDAAFRVPKTDLELPSMWRPPEERVRAPAAAPPGNRSYGRPWNCGWRTRGWATPGRVWRSRPRSKS